MASNYADQDVDALIVNRLSQSKYDELKLSGLIDNNQLYVIEDKTLNAHGKQVLSVADPISASDAATKNYVDQEILKEATERSNADNELSLSLLNKQNSLPQNQGTGVYGISTQYALSTSSAITANTAISVQWSGVQNKAIASATELGLIKVGNNLTIDADGTLNATGGGGGSTEGLRYKLITKTLQEGTYNDQPVLTCQIDDRTTTTIVVNSNEKDVVLYMPPKPSDGGARDFIIRVEVTASTAPGFYFVGVSESINYDSDSDDWSVLEPGLNLISFTETK